MLLRLQIVQDWVLGFSQKFESQWLRHNMAGIGKREMYEKILVPLDGSELAEVALPYTEELAGQLGSEITLIYVRELGQDHQEDIG